MAFASCLDKVSSHKWISQMGFFVPHLSDGERVWVNAAKIPSMDLKFYFESVHREGLSDSPSLEDRGFMHLAVV